jgi:hypothetical protein
LEETVAAPVQKVENTAVGIRHTDHETSSFRKTLALTSLTSGGLSVGIVRSRTKAREFSYSLIIFVLTEIDHWLLSSENVNINNNNNKAFPVKDLEGLLGCEM